MFKPLLVATDEPALRPTPIIPLATEIKRIHYLSPRDVRKNRADAVHMMMSCLGFYSNGVDVTLVTPRVQRSDWSVSRRDLWALYGQKRSFRILELPTVVWEGGGSEKTLRYQQVVLGSVYFIALAFAHLFRGRDHQKQTAVYAKCYASVVPAIVVRKLFRMKWRVVFEKPDQYTKSHLHRFVCNHIDGVIAVTEATLEEVVTHYRCSSDAAVLLPFFSWSNVLVPPPVTHVANAEASLVATYGGKIALVNPEIQMIIDAAEMLDSVNFQLVGASGQEQEKIEAVLQSRGIGNVKILGFQPLASMFAICAESDILISYYDSNPFSARYRSPAKLALYLCAAKPIVLADLPGLRALVDDSVVAFAPADQPRALASSIERLANSPDDRTRLSAASREFALNNDATTAFRKLLDFLANLR